MLGGGGKWEICFATTEKKLKIKKICNQLISCGVENMCIGVQSSQNQYLLCFQILIPIVAKFTKIITFLMRI